MKVGDRVLVTYPGLCRFPGVIEFIGPTGGIDVLRDDGYIAPKLDARLVEVV